MLRLLLTCLVCLTACGPSATPSKASAPSSVLGKSLRFDLPSEQGDRIFIPVRRARATVVTFWSPGCKPCRNWVSALVRLRPDIEAKQAELVLVAVPAEGESAEDAKATLRDWSVVSTFVIDQGGGAQQQSGVTAQPATLVVDQRGTVQWVAPADATVDDLLSAIPE